MLEIYILLNSSKINVVMGDFLAIGCSNSAQMPCWLLGLLRNGKFALSVCFVFPAWSPVIIHHRPITTLKQAVSTWMGSGHAYYGRTVTEWFIFSLTNCVDVCIEMWPAEISPLKPTGCMTTCFVTRKVQRMHTQANVFASIWRLGCRYRSVFVWASVLDAGWYPAGSCRNSKV